MKSLLGLVIFSIPLAVLADAPSVQVDDLFVSMNEGQQPGAAVLVVDDGEVVYRKGFGYADIESGTRIDADSTFRLASVSKQFTAAAILTLVDSGQLQLDDLLTKYIPGLDMYPGITILHLLTHTSGLPDYYDSVDTGDTMPTTADVVGFVAEMNETEFRPGAQYSYSNPAYEILALVVEAASGQDFAQYIEQQVFAPAGMDGALIHDHMPIEIPNRVTGYDCGPEGVVINDFDLLNNIVGSGGMYATLNDFLAWDQSLYNDSVLSDASRLAAFSRAQLNDGATIDYGLGWRLDEYRGRKRIAHGGSWVGFRTAIERYPDEELTIVVLTNCNSYEPEELADAISDIFLP